QCLRGAPNLPSILTGMNRDFVPHAAILAVGKFARESLWNAELDSQLETAPAAHPGQMSRIDGPHGNTARRIAGDGTKWANPEEVAKECHDIEKSRFPRTVRAYQDLEGCDVLSDVS